MPEHRLPTSAAAAAGAPRRHSRRPRRRCRLLLLPAFAVALVTLAYLSFVSHSSLPFHGMHHGLINTENAGKGMDKRYTLNATVNENVSMTKEELEPFKGTKKPHKRLGTNMSIRSSWNFRIYALSVSALIMINDVHDSKLTQSLTPDVPCEIEFLPSVDNLVKLPDYNNFTQFSLSYILKEDHLASNGSLFGGHQSLKEREETYYAQNQSLHCGFVEGPDDYPSSGFDLHEHDRAYMDTCRVVVSSCIFGGSDYLRRPTKSKISSYSKKNACFIMFLDELTLATLSSEGHVPDEKGSIGLWRIVVVKNLPYKDMRRAGKVPKLLAQRLFPAALYSIWLDSKLRLHADPMLIIEYFLWRKKAEYAISMHYDRTCVWEEVLQNKRLNKYNHTAIDEQFYFYQSDGLVKFNASGQEPVLPSYVPEGSFIVRAHTPMSNLFSCLWFNEVNRFTSRDQLSFTYTYLKLRRMNTGSHFHLNMFKDCERRAVTKLFHHRTNKTADPPPTKLRMNKSNSSIPS